MSSVLTASAGTSLVKASASTDEMFVTVTVGEQLFGIPVSFAGIYRLKDNLLVVLNVARFLRVDENATTSMQREIS